MALHWFQKAIDRGSSDAMNNLARMYLVGMGVPRDYVNALRWFERSAAHGNVHSMYSAAVMAEEGLGTSRDPKLARTMYRQAAKSGVVPAMIWVGDDYARGATDERDLVEAYAWLELALQSNVQETTPQPSPAQSAARLSQRNRKKQGQATRYRITVRLDSGSSLIVEETRGLNLRVGDLVRIADGRVYRI